MSDADDPRDLVLTRLIPAPRRALWRAWTEPELLKTWFAPAPYTTPVAELDVRPGGSSLIVMRSPEGQDLPNRGVYLEVVPDTRLVVTDAYSAAWIPSEKPFLTVILTFADEASGTRYTARPSLDARRPPSARGHGVRARLGNVRRSTHRGGEGIGLTAPGSPPHSGCRARPISDSPIPVGQARLG